MTATTNPRTTADAATRRAVFSSATDQWPTPQDFFATLDAEFAFTVDVCADADNRKAAAYYGLDHTDPDRRDGLAGDWAADARTFGGSLWMNPPYGRGIDAWMAKAAATARAGATVVTLVPVRADAAWWHAHVLAAGAEVRYVRGRLKFGTATTSAPFASAVVIYRPTDVVGQPGPATAIDRTGAPLLEGTSATAAPATAEGKHSSTPATEPAAAASSPVARKSSAPVVARKKVSERPMRAHSSDIDAMLELLFGSASAGLDDHAVRPTPPRRARRQPASRTRTAATPSRPTGRQSGPAGTFPGRRTCCSA